MRNVVRTVAWAALWTATVAVCLRAGFDLARMIPDEVPGSVSVFDPSAEASWDPVATFLRILVLVLPLALAIPAVLRWRRDQPSAASTWSVVRTRARRGKT
jgi:hypothetical protein